MDDLKRAVELLSTTGFPEPEFHELDWGSYVMWRFSKEDCLCLPLNKDQVMQPFASVAIAIRSLIDAAKERGYEANPT